MIATGGTGGHIFPALELAAELKKAGHDVHFVGAFRNSFKKIQSQGFAVRELGAVGFSWRTSGAFVLNTLRAAVVSRNVLRDFHPDVVVGFGGYGAFPVVLSAFLLRIPTLLHEQNVVPGKANRILAKLVNRVAISFAKSQKFFKASKTVLTGCPSHQDRVTQDKKDLLRKWGLSADRITLLILGGSQGSHTINMEFLKALAFLKDKVNLQVVHQSGKSDYEEIRKQYAGLKVPFCLFEFIEDVEQVYKIADLVISRAGAVTVSEIALFNLPAILIPYPYAHGHQRENAVILAELNIAKIIDEKFLSAKILSDTIMTCLNQRPSREEIRERIRGMCFPDAAQRLAKEVIALAR